MTTSEADTAELRARARERFDEAQQVLDELRLLERWSAYGEPVVVGSVALDLVVRRDIDLHICCEHPSIADGFAVISALAELPNVRGIRYRDSRDERGQGLYWRLDYDLAADRAWTIDMWVWPPDRQQTTTTTAIKAALRPTDRDTILAIKEAAAARGERAYGHWLYQAVLNHGVGTYDEFLAWLGDRDVWQRTTWRPNRTAP